MDGEGNSLYTCLLLYDCVPTQNTDNSKVVKSGERTCQPDEEKRGKCEPACCPNAPFCHGRCVFGGRACMFHPCSQSPHREDVGISCSQFALEAGDAGGKCHAPCAQVTSDTEADTCQECLENTIHSHCQDLSGQSCWHCSQRIMDSLLTCTQKSSVENINCININQELTERCQACTCTLLCYWIPGGELCKACLEDPQLTKLSVNSDHCPQGWTWVEAETKCVKSFSAKRPWFHASLACQAGGGKLATAKTLQTIQPLIEAINLLAGETGEFWVGGRKNTDGDDYVWGDGTPVSIDDAWDDGYPESGISSSIVNIFVNCNFVNDI